jgi:hypothetical protein
VRPGAPVASGALVLGEVTAGDVEVPVWVGVVTFAPGVTAPGVFVPGALAAGGVALGAVAGGAVALGAVVVGVGVTAGAVVTVVVAGVAVAREFPVSLTRAPASTPSDSVVRTASAMTGAFHFEDAAKRVRAAAPQRRHHSCSG